MTVTAALLTYVVALAVLAPPLLRRAAWVQDSPRLGIIAWQVSVFGVLTATVLLAFAALVPVDRISFDLSHVLHACATRLSAAYEIGDTAAVRVLSLLIAVVTLARLGWALVTQLRRLRRLRRSHRDWLALLGAAGPDGELVIDSDSAAAYCVPGGRGRIVMTSAAVERLSPEQRRAVLAHERSHLHGRHDLVLLGADVAAQALGPLRFFRTARHELRGLVEMLADDAAVRVTGEHPVASALADLGGEPAPRGALGVSGPATGHRIRRLVDRRPAPPLLLRLSLGLGLMVIAALPWVIAVAPAWGARNGFCLPDT